MLCGVTATQGSNPCATAFRLVAPTDVGATSFFVRQVRFGAGCKGSGGNRGHRTLGL